MLMKPCRHHTGGDVPSKVPSRVMYCTYEILSVLNTMVKYRKTWKDSLDPVRFFIVK